MRMFTKPIFKPASGGGGGGSLPSSPTARWEIGNLDAGTLVWTDSSGNGYTLSPSGTPVKEATLGLMGASISGGDYFTNSAIPCPTTGGTLFVFAKADSGMPTYACPIIMRNDANNRIFGMYMNAGNMEPNYNDNYSYTNVPTPTTKWALYAITAGAGNNSVMYKIDDTGTTVSTVTPTLSHRTALDVPVYIGVDSPYFFGTARHFDGSIRHAEYHKNVILTQTQFEDAYDYLN